MSLRNHARWTVVCVALAAAAAALASPAAAHHWHDANRDHDRKGIYDPTAPDRVDVLASTRPDGRIVVSFRMRLGALLTQKHLWSGEARMTDETYATVLAAARDRVARAVEARDAQTKVTFPRFEVAHAPDPVGHDRVEVEITPAKGADALTLKFEDQLTQAHVAVVGAGGASRFVVVDVKANPTMRLPTR